MWLVPLLPLLSNCAKQPLLSGINDAGQASAECERYTQDKDFDKGLKCYELLKSRFRGSGVDIDGELRIADLHFQKKDYLVAAEGYKTFANYHPSHAKTPYAYYRTGVSYLKEDPKSVGRDQKHLEEAIHYLETATQTLDSEVGPIAAEKLREARTRLAQRHYRIGKFYYRTGEYRAAIPRFTDVVTYYNGLGLDEESLYLIGDSYQQLHEKERALEVLDALEKHFPNSPYRKKLAQRLGLK